MAISTLPSAGCLTEATVAKAGAKLQTPNEFKPEERGTLHPRNPPEPAQLTAQPRPAATGHGTGNKQRGAKRGAGAGRDPPALPSPQKSSSTENKAETHDRQAGRNGALPKAAHARASRHRPREPGQASGRAGSRAGKGQGASATRGKSPQPAGAGSPRDRSARAARGSERRA